MGTGYNPRIVTENLVFCVDAANIRSYPKTGTTWSDLKGGNNGTLTNMTSANNYISDNGGVFTFDGADEYVDCGNLDTLDNMSVQISLRVNSNPGLYRAFIGAVGYTGNDYDSGFNIDMQGASTTTFNKCSFEGGIRRVGGGTNLMSSSVDFGVWCTICIVASSSYITMYLNGVEENSASRLNNNTSTIGMNSLVIGKRPYSGVNTCSYVDISNVSIYNRALTADEIRQNYLATKERYA